MEICTRRLQDKVFFCVRTSLFVTWTICVMLSVCICLHSGSVWVELWKEENPTRTCLNSVQCTVFFCFKEFKAVANILTVAKCCVVLLSEGSGSSGLVPLCLFSSIIIRTAAADWGSALYCKTKVTQDRVDQ